LNTALHEGALDAPVVQKSGLLCSALSSLMHALPAFASYVDELEKRLRNALQVTPSEGSPAFAQQGAYISQYCETKSEVVAAPLELLLQAPARAATGTTA
jgi:hypothetical protein